MKIRTILISIAALLVSTQAAADTLHKPFVLASVNEAGLEEQAAATVTALEDAGLTVAGKFMPLDDAMVIVATSEALKDIAAATAHGGYAAGQRDGACPLPVTAASVGSLVDTTPY